MHFVPLLIKNLIFQLFLLLIIKSKFIKANKMDRNLYLMSGVSLILNFLLLVCLQKELSQIQNLFQLWDQNVGILKFIIQIRMIKFPPINKKQLRLNNMKNLPSIFSIHLKNKKLLNNLINSLFNILKTSKKIISYINYKVIKKIQTKKTKKF